jgi:DNA polymerase-3 subunit epsilon
MVRRATPSLFVFPTAGGDGLNLADRSLAVVDLETTGFTPGPDRVIEVAVVRVDRTGAIEDRWVTLVDPGRDVGPTHIHGITPAMVAGAPTFADVATEVLARFSDAVVVAHNAPFEDGFLANEFTTAGFSPLGLPALCTIELARTSRLDVPNFRLATCCEAFGLTNTGAHSALGDALVTAELAVRLLQRGVDLRWPHEPPPAPPTTDPVAVRERPRV